MKLAVVLAIATIIYLLGMKFLVTEYKTYSSSQERAQNQSVPMMLSSSVLYVTFVVHTINLSMQGVLPLL